MPTMTSVNFLYDYNESQLAGIVFDETKSSMYSVYASGRVLTSVMLEQVLDPHRTAVYNFVIDWILQHPQTLDNIESGAWNIAVRKVKHDPIPTGDLPNLLDVLKLGANVIFADGTSIQGQFCNFGIVDQMVAYDRTGKRFDAAWIFGDETDYRNLAAMLKELREARKGS